ncbi:MAG: hypothetical protein WBM90_09935 [Acidimicrobiia bacterium]
MHTASERARQERDSWATLADHWSSDRVPDLWDVRVPSERAVIVFHDPSDDLNRRAREWSHQLPSHQLGALALFAASLAETEAHAWDQSALDVATRAFESRRFLFADRIVHWAVPWLVFAKSLQPDVTTAAQGDIGFLLALGDEMRVAPVLTGREGLVIEGEDSYGPLEEVSTESLWAGMVVIDAANPPPPDRFGEAARIWSEFANLHPGSAQLWLDLAHRARATVARCSGLLADGEHSIDD